MAGSFAFYFISIYLWAVFSCTQICRNIFYLKHNISNIFAMCVCSVYWQFFVIRQRMPTKNWLYIQPSMHKTFVWHLYNVGPTSKTLGRRCTNVIQMFCVCWEHCTIIIRPRRSVAGLMSFDIRVSVLKSLAIFCMVSAVCYVINIQPRVLPVLLPRTELWTHSVQWWATRRQYLTIHLNYIQNIFNYS